MSTIGNAVHVLHVDDEPDFADLTAAYLEREDDRFSVRTATSPEEGLEILSDQDIDCLVSDYDMPQMNGIEFLEAVRAEYPDLPFILFTGKGSEEIASDAISAGVTDYLQKKTGAEQYVILANRITNAVESHRSQRRVEGSRKRLREIIDILPHFLYVVDEEGKYLLANQALADFHGATTGEIEGADVADVLGEGVAEEFIENVEEVLEAGSPLRFSEVEVTDPSGEVHVFEPRLRPYEFDDTGTRAVLGIAADVTERTERERELKRYEAYLQESTDILTVLDESATIEYQSPAVSRVLGYEPEEFVGKNGFDFVHPEDVDEVYAEFTELLSEPGETITVECRFRTADDEWRWLEIRGTNQLHNDAINGVITNNRDITERKQREKQLEALNRATGRLLTAGTLEGVAEIGVEVAQEVLDLKANAIHLYDEERSGLKPVSATEATYDLVGEPPTFTPGDSIAWRVYEQGEARAINAVRDDPDAYNPDTSVRSELYLPLGKYGILIAGSSIPAVFDQQDILLGEVLAGNIVTALEQTEQTQKLRAREQELSRKNDRLEQFASVVSHDLRNPLNVAEGQLELVRDDCDSDRLDAIGRAHERMETLIDDLLTLARQGESTVTTTAVDLGEISEDCWRNVKTGEASLLADVTRSVCADRSRLQQLFENLIRNAIEHGGEGVNVRVGNLDGGFYVEDDGPGIPERTRGSVFEPGYSTSEEGTGFGLSIVDQIVEAHDWNVRVTESSEGGTRFEITGVEFAD